ncbi:helix-turn-helix transcriptional regulator [Actinomadura atramentaria]|uniref:helix-turn-helix transcriptional regulator n=1 Tax=Actinomadura atramentaria TaxID=1990 RepID=UPI003B831743
MPHFAEMINRLVSSEFPLKEWPVPVMVARVFSRGPCGPDSVSVGVWSVGTVDPMRVADVVSELRVPRSTVYRWLATDKGPAWYRLPNGEIRISRADFVEWLGQLETHRKA